MPQDLEFRVGADPGPLLRELERARREIDCFKGDIERSSGAVAQTRGTAAAAGTDATLRQLARERQAVDRHYRGVAADVQRVGRGLGSNVLQDVGRSLGVPIPRGLSMGFAGRVAVPLAAAAIAKESTDSVIAHAAAVRKLGEVGGGSARQLSLLIAVGERLNVTSEQLGAGLSAVRDAIERTPQLFAQLGIALTNADGSARDVADVFEDVRRAASEAGEDSKRFAAVQQVLGSSARDLLPFLSAQERTVAELKGELEGTAEVIDERTLRSLAQLEAASSSLQGGFRGVAHAIGTALLPALATAAEFAADAASIIGNLFGTARTPLADVPVIGGLTNALVNTFDVARGETNAATQQIAENVEKLRELRAKAAAALAAPQMPAPVAGGRAGGRDVGADALRDQMEALRDAQRAREETLREALETFEREKQGRIEALQGMARAAERGYQRDQERLRAGLEAAERAREVEVRGIEDTQEKLSEAFEERERLRDRAIEGLRAESEEHRRVSGLAIEALAKESDAAERAFRGREKARDAEAAAIDAQLRAMDSTEQQARDQQDIAEATAEVDKAAQEDMTRVRSESLEDYARRVEDHDRRLKDARERLAQLTTGIAHRQAREELEAKLEGVRSASAADREALDESRGLADEKVAQIRRVAEEQDQAAQDLIARIEAEAAKDRERTAEADRLADKRIAAVQRQSEEDQRAASEATKALQAQAKTEGEIYDALIAHVQALIKEEKDRVDKAVQEDARRTTSLTTELEKQLKAHTSTASAIGLAWDAAIHDRTQTITTIYREEGSTGPGTFPSPPPFPVQFSELQPTMGAGAQPGVPPRPTHEIPAVMYQPGAYERPATTPRDAHDRARPTTGQDVIDLFQRYLGRPIQASEVSAGGITGRVGLPLAIVESEIAHSPEAEARRRAGVPVTRAFAAGGSMEIPEPSALVEVEDDLTRALVDARRSSGTPHTFAPGESTTVRGPAALVGLESGKVSAIVGEAGMERIDVGHRGEIRVVPTPAGTTQEEQIFRLGEATTN